MNPLAYHVAADYLERRAEFRTDHLELAWQAVNRGELLLGGAMGDRSGVSALFCGERSEDARAIGFDEGDKPAGLTASLEKRGIRVELDLLRQEAVAVLQDYASSSGELYNPRKL